MGGNNRAFVSADASLFNNQLIYEYDNKLFAENIIEWLTGGNHDMVFVFDESHNIPRGTREFSSAAMFGLIQGYINWLSTNPFLAWIYPLWALRTLKKYIPKEQEKKKKKKREEDEAEQQEEELKFRTSSFFAQKINWIRVNKEYNQALTLLYRRVDRKINGMMGSIEPTAENIVAKIEADRGKYITKDKLKRMTTFIEKMKEIKDNDYKVDDVEEFNDLFFEMNWFNDNI
jgi:Rad3-related DNA helicase